MLKKIKFLPKTTSILKNEEGSVIFAALMILVLLTIIGIASTNISNTEVRIAGHEVVYQQNFYQAEGASIEAVERLEAILDPKATPPSWLETTLDMVTDEEVRTWQFGGSPAPEPSTLADTDFIVVSEGIVSGSSLGMGSAKVHGYTVYGRCAPPKRGATVIQLGYLKAF
jgi:hypothetical protein